jgi:hypothetical protein
MYPYPFMRRNEITTPCRLEDEAPTGFADAAAVLERGTTLIAVGPLDP